MGAAMFPSAWGFRKGGSVECMLGICSEEQQCDRSHEVTLVINVCRFLQIIGMFRKLYVSGKFLTYERSQLKLSVNRSSTIAGL